MNAYENDSVNYMILKWYKATRCIISFLLNQNKTKKQYDQKFAHELRNITIDFSSFF